MASRSPSLIVGSAECPFASCGLRPLSAVDPPQALLNGRWGVEERLCLDTTPGLLPYAVGPVGLLLPPPLSRVFPGKNTPVRDADLGNTRLSTLAGTRRPLASGLSSDIRRSSTLHPPSLLSVRCFTPRSRERSSVREVTRSSVRPLASRSRNPVELLLDRDKKTELRRCSLRTDAFVLETVEDTASPPRTWSKIVFQKRMRGKHSTYTG